MLDCYRLVIIIFGVATCLKITSSENLWNDSYTIANKSTPFNYRISDFSKKEQLCQTVYNRCEQVCARLTRCSSANESRVLCKQRRTPALKCTTEPLECLFRTVTDVSCFSKGSHQKKKSVNNKKKCTVYHKKRWLCKKTRCDNPHICKKNFFVRVPCKSGTDVCVSCRGKLAYSKCPEKKDNSYDNLSGQLVQGVSNGKVPNSNEFRRDEAFKFYNKRFHSIQPVQLFSTLPSVAPLESRRGYKPQQMKWPSIAESPTAYRGQRQYPNGRDSSAQKDVKYVPKFDYYPQSSSNPVSFSVYYKSYLRYQRQKRTKREGNKIYNGHVWTIPNFINTTGASDLNEDTFPVSIEPITNELISTLECLKNSFRSKRCQVAEESCRLFHPKFSVLDCQKRACVICNSLSVTSSKQYFYFCRYMRSTYCASLDHNDNEMTFRELSLTRQKPMKTATTDFIRSSERNAKSICQSHILENERCKNGCVVKFCAENFFLKSEMCETERLRRCHSKLKESVSICKREAAIETVCHATSGELKDEFENRNRNSCKFTTFRRGLCKSRNAGESVAKVLSVRRKCVNMHLMQMCGKEKAKLSSRCVKKNCYPLRCFTRKC